MRIVCPSCDVAYDVPDAALTGRPLMRCARCAHEFKLPDAPGVAQPPRHDAPPARTEAPTPEPDPPDAAPPPRAHQPIALSGAGRRRVLIAWAVSLAVILLAIGLGVSYRRPVMHAWPASIRLYAVFGMEPN
jgi:predicted Zn finger-like uncharacterized protein